MIKLRAVIATLGILAVFGCLLSGVPLYGQDQLLKEYIYLDGRLLAVERQPTPAIAQKPAAAKEQDLRAALPVDGNLRPAYQPGIPFPYFQESPEDSVALDQCPGATASSPACVTK